MSTVIIFCSRCGDLWDTHQRRDEHICIGDWTPLRGWPVPHVGDLMECPSCRGSINQRMKFTFEDAIDLAVIRVAYAERQEYPT